MPTPPAGHPAPPPAASACPAQVALLLGVGDVLQVAADDYRAIRTFNLVTGAGGEDGRLAAFNNAGQVAFQARFQDGSQGVFVTVGPDSDGDGINDALDGCPLDPNKSTPGACGCGTPDTDANNDGIADCLQTAEPNQPADNNDPNVTTPPGDGNDPIDANDPNAGHGGPDADLNNGGDLNDANAPSDTNDPARDDVPPPTTSPTACGVRRGHAPRGPRPAGAVRQPSRPANCSPHRLRRLVVEPVPERTGRVTDRQVAVLKIAHKGRRRRDEEQAGGHERISQATDHVCRH
jgi:hypothetical protein